MLPELAIIKLQIERVSDIAMSPPAILILLCLCCALGSSEQLTSQPKVRARRPKIVLPHVEPITLTFQEFKSKYGKQYSSASEQSYRLHIFQANLKRLNEHNLNSSRTYNMKANQFLDVSSTEFKETFTGAIQSDTYSRDVSRDYLDGKGNYTKSQGDSKVQKTAAASKSIEIKAETFSNSTDEDFQANSTRLLVEANESIADQQISLDWSAYAGSIKYQGLCGACYAFSAADTFAAKNAIKKYSFFVPLSVQQIIDCVDNGLTFGCNGGYLEGALTYMQLNGITTEQSYPYQSASSGRARKCQTQGGPFRLSSFNAIEEGDCSSVLTSLQHGPVSAGIAGYNLQFYDTGIFDDCNKVLDHAIVIVGFTSGLGWRIKNSWGTVWGEQGYGWIAEGNTCGICNMAVSVAA